MGRGGVLSFLIGVLGGAVGVILGTLRMPALIRSVGLDVRKAAGTNLVVGFFLGVAGFATHAFGEGVDWPVLAPGSQARSRAGGSGLEQAVAYPRTRCGSRSGSCSWLSDARLPCAWSSRTSVRRRPASARRANR